ncbi:MAG: DUF3300 domain-containing protein [Gammaproteobacteria bacterium]
MRTLVRLLSIQLFVLLFSLPDALRAEEDPAFSQRELDRMLAPVALYPDVVLSQILMAATYPLEVVEAARWSRDNPALDGAEAVDAVAGEDWDASVQALAAFPRLLTRMDEELEWTKQLGDAFLFQQGQVMDTIQDLRRRAYEAGNLDSLEYARVFQDGDMIVIEPADPRVVYIPYYDARAIYGRWWWPAYPPYYWAPPPGYYARAGFYWGGGVLWSAGIHPGYFNWPHHHVVIVTPRSFPHRPGYAHWRDHGAKGDARQWKHDPRHRRGAVYRDRGYEHPYARLRASDRPRDGQYRHGAHAGRPAADRDDRKRKYTSGYDKRRTVAGKDPRSAQRDRIAERGRDAAYRKHAGSPRDMDSGDRRGADRDDAARSPRAQGVQRGKGRWSDRYDVPRGSVRSPEFGRATRHGAPSRASAFDRRGG